MITKLPPLQLFSSLKTSEDPRKASVPHHRSFKSHENWWAWHSVPVPWRGATLYDNTHTAALHTDMKSVLRSKEREKKRNIQFNAVVQIKRLFWVTGSNTKFLVVLLSFAWSSCSGYFPFTFSTFIRLHLSLARNYEEVIKWNYSSLKIGNVLSGWMNDSWIQTWAKPTNRVNAAT